MDREPKIQDVYDRSMISAPLGERCVSVIFEEPFFDDPEITETDNDELTKYETLKEKFEDAAVKQVFGGHDSAPEDLEFDWRDEQELWMRYTFHQKGVTL